MYLTLCIVRDDCDLRLVTLKMVFKKRENSEMCCLDNMG